MRKVFREPEVKRIELNLAENIASSAEEVFDSIAGAFKTRQYEANCQALIVYTSVSWPELLQSADAIWLQARDCAINPKQAARMLNIEFE